MSVIYYIKVTTEVVDDDSDDVIYRFASDDDGIPAANLLHDLVSSTLNDYSLGNRTEDKYYLGATEEPECYSGDDDGNL